MAKELEYFELVERSIQKKFRKSIWTPFINAIKKYELIQEGDKIAVCISGGKDSMLMAKLFQQLKRISNIPFDCIFLVMDPGYKEENRKQIESNAKILNVPIQIFETNIFDVANTIDSSPCYICARMRRGYLYNKAKELGCNKIALGHHFNDVIETTMMGMFYGSQLQAMLPKLHSANFEGMELIRPMYCIKEENIIAWRDYNKLNFIQCACKVTEKLFGGDGAGSSKRQEVKEIIKELSKTNPMIEHNIFTAIHAVKIDSFPGYKQNGVEHTFLDNYDDKLD